MQDKFVIEGMTRFSIQQIAESGQTFRWTKNKNGSYTGIAFGKVINVIQEESKIIINGSSEEDYQKIWKKYFDIDRDYEKLIGDFKGKDIHLDNAILYGEGIRILNQDLWEMIISFIISGNNNIPRIRKSIELICERYGDFIEEIERTSYYKFPTPEQLSVATIQDLRNCGVGYRDAYIYKTTKAIIEKQVDLDAIKDMDLDNARIELKKLTGIGDKVADCILLFSCNKTNTFPIDTWVKKVLTKYYGLEKTGTKEVNAFAREYFGEHCGIAQQYLFYYIRNSKLEEKNK